ncbi:MAG: GNAT family N-acetyltransferase, partial [Oceanicaulis sp.]
MNGRNADATERMTIRSGRLRLVALDRELAALQAADPKAFFTAIGAQSEAVWPPEFFDKTEIADVLDARPGEAGWRPWACLLGWAPGAPDRAVGMVGFNGPPGANGRVELTYAMLPSFREQGLATEMVRALLDWAFGHDEVREVVAFTEPHLTASRR